MEQEKLKFRRLYSAMKGAMLWGIKLYYRNHEVVGYDEHVPKDVPVFFACNHQNAFMDAIVLGTATKIDKQPNFITRADVFNPKTIKFLSLWKMLPIYRQRDGSDSMKKNEEMFSIFVDIFKKNDSIMIFPEGNHGRARRLRPLRKGIARISFQAKEEFEKIGKEEDIHIVPMALNFSNHLNFRGDMLVVFEEPIKVGDYYEKYKKDPSRALIDLKNDIATSMKSCMIHIKNPEHVQTIDQLREIAEEVYPADEDQYSRLLADKEMIANLEEGIESGQIDFESLSSRVEEYFSGLKKLDFRDHTLKNATYSLGGLIIQWILMLLAFPLFLYGYINHALVWHLSTIVPRKLFKDDHFHSSVMFVMGFFLFPIMYLIQAAVVWAVFDWKIALAYLISLPFLGNFSFVYWRAFKKLKSKWKFSMLNRKKDALLMNLKELRAELIELVSSNKLKEKVKEQA
jgi:1-acyl-sn-glycerol-3-phosphate acyltransferase